VISTWPTNDNEDMGSNRGDHNAAHLVDHRRPDSGGDRVVRAMTADERKQRPLYSGVMRYFPDALLEVAHASWVGNEQHNPGKPLHWDRSKSQDEHDACARHLSQAGTFDTDGVRHSAKAAWRALALLQKELEAEQQAARGVTQVMPGVWVVNAKGEVEHSPDATGDSISPEPWGDLF
jgi:hypothetical protein